MKRKLIYLLPIVILFACNQDNKKSDSKEVSENIELSDTEIAKPAEIAETPWMVKVDSATQKINITPSSKVNNADLDINNIIAALNKKYPEIKMLLLKQSTDTVFVKIPDANYLTRESGDMGPQIYMAETTYSFTQIPGINFVNFDFEEGDHASPGTYQRKDFTF